MLNETSQSQKDKHRALQLCEFSRVMRFLETVSGSVGAGGWGGGRGRELLNAGGVSVLQCEEDPGSGLRSEGECTLLNG